MQYFDYKTDAASVEKTYKAIADHVERFGRNPGSLILGFGSYMSLCLTLTERWYGVSAGSSVVFLMEFEGIPITIDPGYEYRITPTRAGSVEEQAVWSILQHKKATTQSPQS
jgi:hypothetical protein